MRKQERAAATYRKLGPFLHDGSVFELIAPRTSFRHPHPARSTAIYVPEVAAMRRLRLIRPLQLRHKCVDLRLSPSIVEIVTSAADHAD
jgi:hypothetical protein